VRARGWGGGHNSNFWMRIAEQLKHKKDVEKEKMKHAEENTQ